MVTSTKTRKKRKKPSKGGAPKCLGLAHEVVKVPDLPVREILEDWEAVDWVQVNQAIRAGHAVRIVTRYFSKGNDTYDNWLACARSQIGEQNAYIIIVGGWMNNKNDSNCTLWLVPRGTLPGMLADHGFDLHEDDLL